MSLNNKIVNTSIIWFFSLWFVLAFLPFKLCYSTYRAYSHEVTAAILVFENNETAAILVLQTNPVGAFLVLKNSFVPINLLYAGNVSEYALFCFHKCN